MPLDGFGPSRPNARAVLAFEKLDEVQSLIRTPDRWCKGSLSTSDGRRCMVAALQMVHAQQMLEPIVLRAIKDVTGKQYRRIERFNDHRTTSHSTVMQVFEVAKNKVANSLIIPGITESKQRINIFFGFGKLLCRLLHA